MGKQSQLRKFKRMTRNEDEMAKTLETMADIGLVERAGTDPHGDPLYKLVELDEAASKRVIKAVNKLSAKTG